MAKEPVDLKKKIRDYRFEHDFLQRIPCTKNENLEYSKIVKEGGRLPEDIAAYIYDDGEVSKTEFYRVYDSGLTESEKVEYLAYKKHDMIRTIKNCAAFFTTLAVIGLIVEFYFAVKVLVQFLAM